MPFQMPLGVKIQISTKGDQWGLGVRDVVCLWGVRIAPNHDGTNWAR